MRTNDNGDCDCRIFAVSASGDAGIWNANLWETVKDVTTVSSLGSGQFSGFANNSNPVPFGGGIANISVTQTPIGENACFTFGIGCFVEGVGLSSSDQFTVCWDEGEDLSPDLENTHIFGVQLTGSCSLAATD